MMELLKTRPLAGAGDLVIWDNIVLQRVIVDTEGAAPHIEQTAAA